MLQLMVHAEVRPGLHTKLQLMTQASVGPASDSLGASCGRQQLGGWWRHGLSRCKGLLKTIFIQAILYCTFINLLFIRIKIISTCYALSWQNFEAQVEFHVIHQIHNHISRLLPQCN
jgi:hypothetical protein